jgi:uncharacterized protein YrzB (UPF0473 family)
MENNDFVVEMTDENGKKVKVEIVKQFDYKNKKYVIANDLENDTDSYILQANLIEGTENVELISVDDEAEFNELCDYLDSIEEE